MKTRLTLPVWRVRSRTVESWRASACAAACWLSLVSRTSPAAAWVAAESENSLALSFLTAATIVAAPVTSTPAPPRAPTPDELGLQLRGLTRVLPQDPDPVQIPAHLTAEELKGGYGVALALSLFSGLLLVATLVLLFGLWARERWFDQAAPSQRPSPARLRDSLQSAARTSARRPGRA